MNPLKATWAPQAQVVGSSSHRTTQMAVSEYHEWSIYNMYIHNTFLFSKYMLYCRDRCSLYHPLPEAQCYDDPLNLVLVGPTSSSFVMFCMSCATATATAARRTTTTPTTPTTTVFVGCLCVCIAALQDEEGMYPLHWWGGCHRWISRRWRRQ